MKYYFVRWSETSATTMENLIDVFFSFANKLSHIDVVKLRVPWFTVKTRRISYCGSLYLI